MNATKAREIFMELVAHVPPEQWQGRLAEWAGDDAELHDKVARLLAAHRQADSFLEHPAAPLGSTVDDVPASAAPAGPPTEPGVIERPGTIIGPYKLLEQIGEGGFGVVFMAEQQQPLRRKVAFKVVKPGMDSKQVIARFEAERQALALMDHPNIARVLDAGTTDTGRPYFVMELVKGIPITQFCDNNRLTTQERLKLFVQVCQAVQHAHQKGIIHRDLKPSNVLVTLHDGTPVTKVIDFGIAKALGQQLTDKTLFTGFAQMVGTPLYMSPEQAGLSGLDVDTRSDLYSLGVLLYELLTGTTPFDKERLQRSAYEEMLRIIREEEPPKPSTRITTQGQAAETVSTQRQSDPKRLSRMLAGELDWIVMKTLEKDRNRRYESASALAADVQRHLNQEPVQACPPSAGYRLQKFARRNKVVLATTALVAVALLVGTTVSLWQAIEANRARQLADQQRQRAEQQRQRAEGNLALARQAVDDMYTQVAEKWLAEQPRMTEVQRQFLEKALKLYQGFAQQAGTEPAVQLETAGAYFRVAKIQHTLGAHAEAETAYRAALHILEPLAAEFPTVPEYRDRLARTYNNLGNLRAALKLEEQLVREFPTVPEYRAILANINNNLGLDLDHTGKLAEAETAHRAALKLREQLATEYPTVPEYRAALAQSHCNLV
jgi:serine/threonine protein kinase